MPSFKIEDAAFAGVGLLARHPGAALIWAFLWTAVIALVTVPFAAGLAEFVSTIARSGPQVDPATMLPLFASLGAFMILTLLFSLALGSVISCAVYRAVFTPEDSAFAYLRLGEQEIHVLLVNFVKFAIIFGVSLGLGMLLGIVSLIARAGGEAAGRLVGDLGEIAVQVVLIWIHLRFAFAGPMTFLDHHFRLFESWPMTRGMVLRLLAVGLILALICLVAYFALVMLGVTVGAAMWSAAPRATDLQSLLAQPTSVWIPALAPYLLLTGFLVTIGGAILTPIVNAPWAQAWRSLTASADPAATFS
jgi:hypothetical protein